MNYLRKVPSLEERASLEVALNLCQENSFKAAALCLERPTYGFFHLEEGFHIYVNNPDKIKFDEKESGSSIIRPKLDDRNKDDYHLDYCKNPTFVNDQRILSVLKQSIFFSNLDVWTDEVSAGEWYSAVDEQCQKLLINLPHSLKFSVCTWINRIAFEYLSYCRRQEVLFGVSRYFLMNFLTRGDWTNACRLNEKKLAERLLKDKRLTVLQQYRIACVYCLLDDIPRLWKKLTRTDKSNIYENIEPTVSQETNRLIQIWSLHMDKNRDAKVIGKDREIWSNVVRQLIVYGNLALLLPFWKELEKNIQQDMIIDLALMSVIHFHNECDWNRSIYSSKERFLSNEVFSKRNYPLSRFNLKSYYSELILFFLLEMNEDQRFLFFQKAFESEEFKEEVINILECFLDWGIRDYFYETLDQLWEILPMDLYKDCLVMLVSLYSEHYNVTLKLEYSENYKHYYYSIEDKVPQSLVWDFMYCDYCRSHSKKGNQNYDYRNLLQKLWGKTPQEYKQCIFSDLETGYYFKEHKIDELSFFVQLLKKSPFEKRDEALFKLIFCDLPEIDRIPMIHSKAGVEICSKLLEKGNYSLVTWFLQLCLEEHRIPHYKKQLIQSESGIMLSFYKLHENHESSLIDLLDWSFDFDSEKAQFKHELFSKQNNLTECKLLLSRGEFTEVERIMNFCLLSDEFKKEFKVRFAEPTCDTLLNENNFELLDKVLMWCFDKEESIKKFKNYFFIRVGLKTHFQLVFLEKWRDVQWFYEWFDLSLEEIRKLKKKTISKNFRFIKRILFNPEDVMSFYVAPLRWCLTDEKKVIRFKSSVKKKYFTYISKDKKRIAKKRLSFLVQELLSGIKKDVQDDATRDSPTSKNGERKRFLEEYTSEAPKKRLNNRLTSFMFEM